METLECLISGAAYQRGSTPAALGLILSVPNNFSLDEAEFHWRHCLEKLLDYVNRIHLEQASGKLVLQKVSFITIGVFFSY